MSSRKKKQNRQRGYAKELIIKHLPKQKCPNCGENGPHFVPPSMGERGQFICEKKIKLDLPVNWNSEDGGFVQ